MALSFLAVVLGSTGLNSVAMAPSASAASGSVTFSYTGVPQSFVVPSSVSLITVDV